MTQQQMKAYKFLEAHNVFTNGWVQGLAAKQLLSKLVTVLSEMSSAIVEFTETEEVEVVPANWINGDVCSWPGEKVEKGRKSAQSVYAGEPSIEMNSFDDLKCLIQYTEKLKLCQGCPAEKYPKIASSLVATKEGEKWRRNTCTIIKQFLDVLNVTEENALEKSTKLFASQLTTESLRVTLLSTLDIISYLFDKEAVYVLTAKLNQDPLERHFGLARSFGGDESHPTVVNFTQIFRLLSLYTSITSITVHIHHIKTALRGSVQGEPNAVLVSVEDTLKTAGEAHRSKRASLRTEIEARLLEMTSFPCITPDQMSDEHSYFRSSPDGSVVYYLAGYVVHKMGKRKECQLCLQDVSSEASVIGSDAYLTTYRSFKEGSLRHPSIKMLHFMRVVN
ncbi:hypothetical protein HPB50_007965 [Hyalomma asiaticum]|uniref:Uncharacterized protein n=1 Tax=Hyalomma asiaticum TaxID=266040 RepID=A0ACB7S8D0_HYAAI|nr:hypothetical protein HPB50_007965 [Hyalomma asiaticum]